MNKPDSPSSLAAPLIANITSSQEGKDASVASLSQRFTDSVNSGTFIRLTLGKPKPSAVLQRVVITLISLKSGTKLSFRESTAKGEQIKNFSTVEAGKYFESLMGETFQSATLFTTTEDLTLHLARKGQVSLKRSKPTLKAAPPQQHNREKNYLIKPDAPFLAELGIANAQGSIRGDKFDKFRQINKYIEIIESLINHSELQETNSISTIDYGSGKNYLTFSLHAYLSEIRGLLAKTIGIEAREDLVEHGNKIAGLCEYDDLSFQHGYIADSPELKSDIVVALHACDTATDDALAKAIRASTAIIAVAPCCQKYLRPKMTVPPDLKPIFKHGIMEERLAESLTNGLRALTLEAYGYSTKVFEFIAGEHTAKNIMITAVRQHSRSGLNQAKLTEITAVKNRFGINDFYLDRLLELSM